MGLRGRKPSPGPAWDARNKDKHRVYEQNRLAKLRTTGSLSPNLVSRLLVEQLMRCVYCGCDISACNTLDHKTPISRGGTNTDDNMQLLCGPCNSQKWARTHEEYLERMK